MTDKLVLVNARPDGLHMWDWTPAIAASQYLVFPLPYQPIALRLSIGTWWWRPEITERYTSIIMGYQWDPSAEDPHKLEVIIGHIQIRPFRFYPKLAPACSCAFDDATPFPLDQLPAEMHWTLDILNPAGGRTH